MDFPAGSEHIPAHSMRFYPDSCWFMLVKFNSCSFLTSSASFLADQIVVSARSSGFLIGSGDLSLDWATWSNHWDYCSRAVLD
jgi:hypothetical protein